MSLRERESKNSNTHTDIGAFVAKYQKLVELLFPVYAACDAILYIARWQNYLLTLAVMAILSCIMYYPVLLFSVLTLSAISIMGVGRYYAQTHPLTVKRLRELPAVVHLDQDQQTLRRYYKEQKNAHKLLVEYRQIMKRAEDFIMATLSCIERIYSIILWKSPEVSLCVTVLLCVMFVLLCTVYLKTIAACLPLIVLCSNRHFFKRTVDTWRTVWNYVYNKTRRSKAKKKETESPTVDGRAPLHPSEETQAPIIVTTPPTPSEEEGNGVGPEQPRETGSSGSAQPSSDEDETLQPFESRPRSDSTGAQLPPVSSQISVSSNGSAITQEAENGNTRGAAIRKDVKGFCFKCGASFAKLLKRKHDCSSCGQSFCGSCTVKVKRTLLGATSPQAYEGTVRVCLDCKLSLDEMIDARAADS